MKPTSPSHMSTITLFLKLFKMHGSSGPPGNGLEKLSSNDCSGSLVEGRCSQGCVDAKLKPGAGGCSGTYVSLVLE